jgi:hypothetical protein
LIGEWCGEVGLDATACQDQESVCAFGGFVEVMCGKEHESSFFAPCLDECEQELAGGWIESGKGFVEEQKGGVVECGACECSAL